MITSSLTPSKKNDTEDTQQQKFCGLLLLEEAFLFFAKNNAKSMFSHVGLELRKTGLLKNNKVKSCVCYIFAGLFCKGEHMRNKEKCFIQSRNEIWPVYVIIQKKNFYQKIIWKMWSGN